MISNKKHVLISYPIIVFLFVVDQTTKFFLAHKYFDVIPNVLSVHYSENTGAAWSIMAGKVEFLAVMSVLFLAVLIFFSYKFNEKTYFYSIAYSFIIGGALGNLFDRILFGYVRDFIKADFITFTNFPIFNFADSFLVFGVILFCIFVLFIYPKKLKE
jgi:signal peptidase II